MAVLQNILFELFALMPYFSYETYMPIMKLHRMEEFISFKTKFWLRTRFSLTQVSDHKIRCDMVNVIQKLHWNLHIVSSIKASNFLSAP